MAVGKKITAFLNNVRLNACFAFRRLGIPGFQIHQICLSDQQLIYIPIPKNACSTVMHALHEIEFGYEYSYDTHRPWGYRDIHDYYQKRADAFTSVSALKQTSFTTFAIVRDPVKRLISCYRNRVVDLKDLEKSRIILQHEGIPVAPNINTFILRLEDYQKASKVIEHHSRPQEQFLDDSLEYLDRIYPIEEFDKLVDMLKQYKPDLEMKSKKTGGTSYSLQDLSAEALEKALTFYKKDYELLNDYYSRKQIKKEYQN